jgi:hypothetical protein
LETLPDKAWGRIASSSGSRRIILEPIAFADRGFSCAYWHGTSSRRARKRALPTMGDRTRIQLITSKLQLRGGDTFRPSGTSCASCPSASTLAVRFSG